MRLVLLGPPGAGKGTLANLLKVSLKIKHVSTGDLLREELKNNSPVGIEAKKFIENGQLVPDELVTRLIEYKVKSGDISQAGFLLDGFPRTKKQAEDLDKILKEAKYSIDYALDLESTLPVILKRLTGRRICRNCGAVFHITNRPSKNQGICDHCGGQLYQRADDKEETIKTRINVYAENTKPIIEYYKQQNKLLILDSDKESEVLQEELMLIFNETRQVHKH